MKIERLDSSSYRIPRQGRMQVDGIVFADGRIWKDVSGDPCVDQVANVACLPGILQASLAMPDIHWGYGFPIGGVAAFDLEAGVVSPGGVGYDINCGVRMLTTNLRKDDVANRVREIVGTMFRCIPSGVGSRHKEIVLSRQEMKQVCELGAAWAVRSGYGDDQVLDHIEDRGRLPAADFDAVSDRAFERGRNQLGTLGSGNHFVELDVVDQVLLPDAAGRLGLAPGNVVFSIHTGSRGFGYQICSESIERLQAAAGRYGFDLPDRQLVCAPIRSPEGERYLAAMACAANFAFANRQVISHFLQAGLEELLGKHNVTTSLLYDVCHNIAKIERHTVEGRDVNVCVHRKGATRALPPNHPLVPETYRDLGQPVLIPGDMGRCSYVLLGLPAALHKSFGSCAHGAGRLMSRNEALKRTKGRDIQAELSHKGIVVVAAGRSTVREEFPDAYKDVDDVIRVIQNAGLARPVARLTPLGCIKG